MTVAVCLKCGEFKHGAWTPCGKCGYTPDDDESLTKHLLITDHYLTRPQLEEVSQLVKSGLPVEIPDETLKKAWVKKSSLDRANRGCAIGCTSFLVLLLCAAVWFLIWRLRNAG